MVSLPLIYKPTSSYSVDFCIFELPLYKSYTMKKGTLPTGTNRKRWIERLPQEVYDSLNPKDKENYKKFRNYSKWREGKELTIKNLRTKIKDLKEEIKLLDEKEESNYINGQIIRADGGMH